MSLRVDLVMLCVLVSVEYGFLHELLTAHISREYFTIGAFIYGALPSWLPCDRLTLAIYFGIMYFWWIGLALGILLVLFCRELNFIKVFWLLQRMCLMGFFLALIGAIVGGYLASAELLHIPPLLVGMIGRTDRVVAFQSAVDAHAVSYTYWLIVGSLLIYRCREKSSRNKRGPGTGFAGSAK